VSNVLYFRNVLNYDPLQNDIESFYKKFFNARTTLSNEKKKKS